MTVPRPTARTPRTRLLALCLSSAALAGPLHAGPAGAVELPGVTTGPEQVLTTVSTTQSFSGRVEAFVPPTGARELFGQEASLPLFTETRRVHVAESGDRVVTLEQVDTRVQVVVRDLSGAVVRVLPPPQGAPDVFDAVLTRDGTGVIVFAGVSVSRCDCFGEAFLFTTPVDGGPYTKVPNSDTREGIPLGQSQERVDPITDDLVLYEREVISLSTGQRTRLLGLVVPDRNLVSHLVLNRDATQLVYRRTDFSTDPSSGSRPAPSRLEIAPVVRVGAQLTVGPARVLTALGDAEGFNVAGRSVFSLDEQDVHYVLTDGDQSTFDGDLYTVPVAGGTGVPLGPLTPGRRESSLGVARAEATAPAALQSVGPAALGGTTATIPYAVAPDPTASRVVATRTSPGRPTVTLDAVVPAPLEDSGLVVGATYTYEVRQVDRSGNAGPASTLTLTATAPPALTFADPTSGASTSPSFVVRFAAAGNAPTTRYTVGQQVIGGTPSVWTSGTTSPARLLGHPGAPPTVAATTVAPGTTYGFTGYAEDTHGNRTAITTSGRAVVPVDQRGLTTRGLTTQLTRPGAYGGTTAFLRRAGADINARVTGDRFQVIGERSGATGAFDVFLSGQRLARVDTRGPQGVRRVLWSRDFPTSRSGVLTVRAVGTAGRPTVVVDAISQRARP